jgi:phosphoglycolate phosphatase-like HAD superfamily hydrolase
VTPDGTTRPATLVLFDIDGTLVLTGRAGVRAFGRAFEELFASAPSLEDLSVAGRTDPWVLASLAEASGVPADAPALSRFHDVYVRHLAIEIEKPGPRKGMMPGVGPLLDALSARDDVHLALLTGNYERAARIKLEYFGLWRYFRGGAFGDAALERNELLPRALAAVARLGGPAPGPEDTVVVGDTPLDVACARASGARSIAVATGSYDESSLGEAGADVVLRDLSDIPAVLRALRLKNC